MKDLEIDWFWLNMMIFAYLNYWCIEQLLDGYYSHKRDMKEERDE